MPYQPFEIDKVRYEPWASLEDQIKEITELRKELLSIHDQVRAARATYWNLRYADAPQTDINNARASMDKIEEIDKSKQRRLILLDTQIKILRTR